MNSENPLEKLNELKEALEQKPERQRDINENLALIQVLKKYRSNLPMLGEQLAKKSVDSGVLNKNFPVSMSMARLIREIEAINKDIEAGSDVSSSRVADIHVKFTELDGKYQDFLNFAKENEVEMTNGATNTAVSNKPQEINEEVPESLETLEQKGADKNTKPESSSSDAEPSPEENIALKKLRESYQIDTDQPFSTEDGKRIKLEDIRKNLNNDFEGVGYSNVEIQEFFKHVFNQLSLEIRNLNEELNSLGKEKRDNRTKVFDEISKQYKKLHQEVFAFLQTPPKSEKLTDLGNEEESAGGEPTASVEKEKAGQKLDKNEAKWVHDLIDRAERGEASNKEMRLLNILLSGEVSNDGQTGTIDAVYKERKKRKEQAEKDFSYEQDFKSDSYEGKIRGGMTFSGEIKDRFPNAFRPPQTPETTPEAEANETSNVELTSEELSPESDKEKERQEVVAKWREAREKSDAIEKDYNEKYRAYTEEQESHGFFSKKGFGVKMRRWFGFQPKLNEELTKLKGESVAARSEYFNWAKKLKETHSIKPVYTVDKNTGEVLSRERTYDEAEKVVARYQRLLARKLTYRPAQERIDVQKTAVEKAWEGTRMHRLSEKIAHDKKLRYTLMFLAPAALGAASGAALATLGVAGVAAGATYGAYRAGKMTLFNAALMFGTGTTAGGLTRGVFSEGGNRLFTENLAKSAKDKVLTESDNLFNKDFATLEANIEKAVIRTSSSERLVDTVSKIAAFGGGAWVAGQVSEATSIPGIDTPASEVPPGKGVVKGDAIGGGESAENKEPIPETVDENTAKEEVKDKVNGNGEGASHDMHNDKPAVPYDPEKNGPDRIVYDGNKDTADGEFKEPDLAYAESKYWNGQHTKPDDVGGKSEVSFKPETEGVLAEKGDRLTLGQERNTMAAEAAESATHKEGVAIPTPRPEDSVANAESVSTPTPRPEYAGYDGDIQWYPLEKGDNYWDIVEGQTNAGKLSTFEWTKENMPELFQSLIKTTQQVIEHNPELVDALGFDGDLDHIEEGTAVPIDFINALAWEVAEFKGIPVPEMGAEAELSDYAKDYIKSLVRDAYKSGIVF